MTEFLVYRPKPRRASVPHPAHGSVATASSARPPARTSSPRRCRQRERGQVTRSSSERTRSNTDDRTLRRCLRSAPHGARRARQGRMGAVRLRRLCRSRRRHAGSRGMTCAGRHPAAVGRGGLPDARIMLIFIRGRSTSSAIALRRPGSSSVPTIASFRAGGSRIGPARSSRGRHAAGVSDRRGSRRCSPRSGIPERWEFFEIEPIELSSTEIRARVSRGESIDGSYPPRCSRNRPLVAVQSRDSASLDLPQ